MKKGGGRAVSQSAEDTQPKAIVITTATTATTAGGRVSFFRKDHLRHAAGARQQGVQEERGDFGGERRSGG